MSSPRTNDASVIFLAAALALVLISNALAIAIIAVFGSSLYVDIVGICQLLALGHQECAASAQIVGLTECSASVLLLAFLVAINRRFPAKSAFRVGRGAFVTIAPAIAFMLCYALFADSRSPLPIYRMEIFTQHPAAVSIGNLLWPLCLQLANNSVTLKWRILFLCLCAPIIALSPFRGVTFAIALFGILLPLAVFAVRQGGIHGVRTWRTGAPIAIVVCIAGLTVLQLAVQTKNRPTDLKISGGILSDIAEKLGQRIAIPLYQARFASNYVLNDDVPSVADELLTKLRLRNAWSLNQFLYTKSRGGAAYGETTSLFYGEGLLRTTTTPLMWSIIAPLGLILTWAMLRRLGFDASVLVGIAIWRGSLGGILAIIPALAIQISTVVLLSYYWSKRSDQKRSVHRPNLGA